jgi:nucleotide-binding universal stress UspA family protein
VNAHEFELLVLGRHGTGGLLRSRLQLGRVAETVTKKSGISLLLLGQS